MPLPIVRVLPDLSDRWMYRPAAAEYMGISVRTLRRRNAAGRCMPHGTDGDNEPLWLKSAIDAELMYGASPDYSELKSRKQATTPRPPRSIKTQVKI